MLVDKLRKQGDARKIQKKIYELIKVNDVYADKVGIFEGKI